MYWGIESDPDFRTSTPGRDRYRSIAEIDEINRSTVRSRFPYETQSNMGTFSQADYVGYSTPRKSVTFDPSVVPDTPYPQSTRTLGMSSSKDFGQSNPACTTTTLTHSHLLKPSIACRASTVGHFPYDFSMFGLNTDKATQTGIGVNAQIQQTGAQQHASIFSPSSNAGPLTKKEIEPPIFTGQGNWKHFIFRFEQIAAYNGWDDRMKRLRLTICLDGDALDYCGTLQSVENLTYANLKDALNSRFAFPENQNMYRSQFRSRVRQENEDIRAFLGDLQKLASKAFPKEQNDLFHQLICDQFTQGIRNRECREFLQLEMSKSKASGPMLVQEMLTLALNFEAFRGQLDKPHKPMTDFDRPSHFASGPRNDNFGQADYYRPNRYQPHNAERHYNADRQYNVERPYNSERQYNAERSMQNPRSIQNNYRPMQQNPRHMQQNQGHSDRNPQYNRDHNYQKSRIICDICNREGHVASRCWFANQGN